LKAERALFVSNLFPSSVEPGRGRFNLDQLIALREAGLDATVVTPRPWFPGPHGRSAAHPPFPPPEETIEGFRVLHRRAPYVPLWRGSLNGRLYGWSALGACRAAAKAFSPDFLWVSFAFPDAVGAAWVARRLRLPLVVSVHGSDVNVSFRMPWRRRAMLDAFQKATCVFCKSAALRDTLLQAGTGPEHVLVVYNGIDPIFHSRSREAACRELGVDVGRRRILFVGNLVPVKGVSALLEAFRVASTSAGPTLELVIVGDGPLQGHLKSQTHRLGIESAVRFAGRETRPRVALWMSASHVLALPSLEEGVPNVVLEAFASGRPVVATAVGGVPEVHPGDTAGALVSPAEPSTLAAALTATLDREWREESLSALVRGFSWSENSRVILGALRASAPVQAQANA
jgi:glycosyltransferase involved in cell wall biosynthesis